MTVAGFQEMRIKEMRASLHSLGLTQADLCRLVGTYTTTMSRWVTEDRVPNPVAAYLRLALEVRKLAALTTPAPRQ